MSEKRFTDIWCSETGHIGVTDCGIDKEFTSDEFEDFLNELSEEKEYFERKKEYFLSKWSIANAENIQLKQENRELKKENEQLKQK